MRDLSVSLLLFLVSCAFLSCVTSGLEIREENDLLTRFVCTRDELAEDLIRALDSCTLYVSTYRELDLLSRCRKRVFASRSLSLDQQRKELCFNQTAEDQFKGCIEDIMEQEGSDLPQVGYSELNRFSICVQKVAARTSRSAQRPRANRPNALSNEQFVVSTNEQYGVQDDDQYNARSGKITAQTAAPVIPPKRSRAREVFTSGATGYLSSTSIPAYLQSSTAANDSTETEFAIKLTTVRSKDVNRTRPSKTPTLSDFYRD